jgi:hypothetical protein
MNASRLTVVVSLLCLAAMCLFASSAAAAVAKNTTVFTCVEGGGQKDFTDAHCDNKVAAGAGNFGHVAINLNQETSLITTNNRTKENTTKSSEAVFEVAGFLNLKVKCIEVSGEGTVANEQPAVGSHQTFGFLTIKYNGCTVEPAPCKVASIELSTKFEGVEGLGVGGKEMGLEFLPNALGKFGILKVTECALEGKYSIHGSMVATGTPGPAEKFTGATWSFTNAMTETTLLIGAEPAKLESKMTARMGPVGGVEQNPLALTTVT